MEKGEVEEDNRDALELATPSARINLGKAVCGLTTELCTCGSLEGYNRQIKIITPIKVNKYEDDKVT